MRPKTDAGFTFVETLVAMSVLAVSAAAILPATEAHLRNVSGVSDRMVSIWVAENRMTELANGRSNLPNRVHMAGHDWIVDTRLSATSDPEIQRVDLKVGRDGAGEGLAHLTGFIIATDAP